MKRRKPLEKCCNGCDAAPQPPSLVLCAKCLHGLDEKIRALPETLGLPPPNGGGAR